MNDKQNQVIQISAETSSFTGNSSNHTHNTEKYVMHVDKPIYTKTKTICIHTETHTHTHTHICKEQNRHVKFQQKKKKRKTTLT